MARNLSKEYIFEAFYNLLSKKHYNDITVNEICNKAGVSRMSFYRIFSSKEDLSFRGLDMVVDNIKLNIEKLDIKNVFTVTKSIFETIQKYSIVISSFEDSTIAKSIAEYVTEKLQMKITIDYISKTSKYLPVFYFSAVASVILKWLKDGAEETPDEMARLIVSLVNVKIFKEKSIEGEEDIDNLEE